MSELARVPTAEIVLNWREGVDVRAEIVDGLALSRPTREMTIVELTTQVILCESACCRCHSCNPPYRTRK